MKKHIKIILSMLLAAVIVFGAVPGQSFSGLPELLKSPFLFGAEAADYCGPALKYTYNKETGTLVITGSGSMSDFRTDLASQAPPWNSYASSIKAVQFPAEITSIGAYAFYGCIGISAISFPEKVTRIGSKAFYGCSGLTSVNIGKGVTFIDSSAFDYCKNLETISVYTGNTKYKSEEGVLFNFEKTTLVKYPIGNTRTNYSIPDSVTSIGDNAFSYCTTLLYVTIGNSVMSIGYRAFYHCTALASITIPDSVETIGDAAFYECFGLTSVAIGKNVTSIGDSAFSRCIWLSDVYINRGHATLSIGNNNYDFQSVRWHYDTVMPKQISEISIQSSPQKLQYFVGETIAPIGLTLTVSYTDGTSETFSDGFTCDTAVLNTAGTKTVNVLYGGKSCSFDVDVDEVALTGIDVKTLPTKTDYFVGDMFSASGLSLELSYNNGAKEIIVSGFECIPADFDTAGTKVVTVNYGGKSCTFNVIVTVAELSSVAIKTAPTKIYYFAGEALNADGLSLELTYNNGSKKVMDSGFDCTPTVLDSAGKQSITICYSDKSCTFDVYVVAVELSSVAVKTYPTKTDYFVGDVLNSNGLSLELTYNNGSKEVIDSGFVLAPISLNTIGAQTIIVAYCGKSCTFDVNVAPVELLSVSVKTMPSKTYYFVGDTLDTTGLTLTATNNNGLTETMTTGFTCDTTGLNTAGAKTVTVSYGGKTCTFDVNVTAVALESIAVKTPANKLNYFVGDTLDTTGLTLTATNNNGSTETMTTGFTCDTTGLNTAGAKTVTVSYGGKICTFDVNVTAVALESISVKSQPTKANYFVGDALDTAGLTLTVTNNNGSTETMTTGFTCDTTGLNTAGAKTVTVSYGGKTCTFDVNVTAVALENISVKSQPTKLNYSVGEALDTAGLAIELTYNSGKKETVASGFTCMPTALSTAGSQTITVSYGGKTCTFSVKVKRALPETISIKAPSTTTINYGYTLNFHANIEFVPNGYKLVWNVEGSGVSIKPSVDGLTCVVTSTANGNAKVTVKLVDENSNVAKNSNGEEITASQQLTSKAGFFQKLTAFFKKLFGGNMVMNAMFDTIAVLDQVI